MIRMRGRLIAAPYLLIGAALLLLFLSLLLPFPELERFREAPWSLRVVDRRGGLLQLLPAEESGLRRERLKREQVPDYLIRIFIVGEDRRFYLHPGVDPAATLRAALDNLIAGRVVSGASTISMQLAGRIVPGGGGLSAKIAEAWNALRLELRLGKGEILDLWLSTLPLGSNVEGVAAGAREIFGREAAFLMPEQAALLALVPRNPSRYDPRGGNKAAQTGAALRLLRAADLPTDEALLEQARRSATSGSSWPFRAPHFVAFAAERAEGDGELLETTLDPDLQSLLEGILGAAVERSAGHRIGTGAAVALDVVSGEILAWVGSKEFFDEASRGQIDGVRILRQPGSTIKPFLYSLALDRGMTAATLLPDVPLEFGGEAVYTPENFSNTYHGPVRLRTALASSLNIPAVYTVTRVGVAEFAERLLSLGFESIESQREYLGAGLALGNAEVSLLELTAAFAVFQRGGIYLPPSAVPAGKPAGRRVMDAETAFLIRSILGDDAGRIPGFGTGSILNTPFEAIFKTGTSNQFTNIWALGATRRVAVGVWMGNFTGETVIGRPGSSLPAAAAVEFLSAARELPGWKEDAAGAGLPPGMEEVEICSFSGMARGPLCPGAVWEYFRSDRVPGTCTFHTPAGTVLPAEFRKWVELKETSARVAGGTELRILTPVSGARFYIDPLVPRSSQGVTVEAAGPGAFELYHDGELLAAAEGFLRVRVPLYRGDHTILLTAAGERRSASYSVR